MSNKETNIERNIMLALSQDGLLIWKQVVGRFRHMYSSGYIDVGINGMADTGSIMPITITQEMVGRTVGLAIQLEVKTFEPGSRQSKEQKTWQQAVENRGGIYLIARSPEEARSLLAERIKKIQSGA
jgi:hypothetical protein